VREFLSVNNVPFEDRNIRRSEEARTELGDRTSELVVPQLFWGETHIVGFDADALDRLAAEFHGRRPQAGAAAPPGNSLAASQGGKVAAAGDSLADGLVALLDRVRQEIEFNEAKGGGSYRLGMHDALRFADDALVELLRSHGNPVDENPRAGDA
jgi:glutaredoxin